MAPASNLRSKFLVSSVACVAALAATSTAAHAYSVKKTTHGDLVHWETDTVNFTIDPSVDANVDAGSAATKKAMVSWSGKGGAPDIDVVDADAKSPTKPSFDRKNGVFYAVGGYEPAGRALAITVLTYDNATGKILDADVVFNGSYQFKVLGTQNLDAAHLPTLAGGVAGDTVTHDEGTADEGDLDSIYDLHHVVAHELGHSLGMNDEMGNKAALMYRYTAPNDATLRAPAADDVTGVAQLYEDAPKATDQGGCGSDTVAPKKPSHAASNAAMVATLGLLLFMVLRAKKDRRAKGAFVLAAACAAVALVPNLTGKGVARANTTVGELNANLNLGHARAKILSTSVAIENGLFKTQYALNTTTCRASLCPKGGQGITYGGTIGNITQEVGGYYAPKNGDEVDVSFKKMPNALSAVRSPLAGRLALETQVTSDLADVRVVTHAAN